MSTPIVLAYLLVGALVALRVSTAKAWRIQAKKSGGRYVPERMNFWERPDPFFTFLFVAALWPVAWAVPLVVKPLSQPPRDMRLEAARERVAQLERELSD